MPNPRSPPIVNHLQVLQGYTELALLRLTHELPPDHPVRSDLRQVLAACTRLHALLAQASLSSDR